MLFRSVKTVIQTETVGDWEQVIIYQKTDGEFTTENFIYKLSNADPSGSYVYHKYPIIKTDIVTETEVPDDSQSSDVSVKVVPTVDPEAEAAYQRELQEAIEKAREEAEVKVQKEAEQKTEDFVKEIAKMTEQAIQTSAKEDEANGEEAGTPTAVIKTDYFTCFTQDMLKQLAANSNVNYEIHYR